MHLMVTTRVIDSIGLTMAIYLRFFFRIKRQNGECFVKIVRCFLFGMSSDVPARHSKATFLTDDYNIESE